MTKHPNIGKLNRKDVNASGSISRGISFFGRTQKAQELISTPITLWYWRKITVEIVQRTLNDGDMETEVEVDSDSTLSADEEESFLKRNSGDDYKVNHDAMARSRDFEHHVGNSKETGLQIGTLKPPPAHLSKLTQMRHILGQFIRKSSSITISCCYSNPQRCRGLSSRP